MSDCDKDIVHERFFRAGKYTLPLNGKTLVMGILNVTPDSFSDGGLYSRNEAAVAHAEMMVSEGADMIDVGGESTRPGHTPVDEKEETKRILPVISKISCDFDIPISVDTSKHSVAKAAVAAGASIINDVWGLRRDPLIAKVAAENKTGLILMFNATDESIVRKTKDIVEDAILYLSKSIEIALESGVSQDSIVIDPGIGFGVDTAESFSLIQGIPRLLALGYPVLIGPSKKRFIGEALNLPVEQRGIGTVSATCIGAYIGANIIRVHDVVGTVQGLTITDAIQYGYERGKHE